MKYLVNRETKEHKIYNGWGHQKELSDAGETWELVEADPEGWIKHDGDVNPLPDDCECEIKTKTMNTMKNVSSGWFWGQPTVIEFYRPILNDNQRPDFGYGDSFVDDKPVHVGVDMAVGPDYAATMLIDRRNVLDRLKSAHKAASELPDIIAELREVLEPMGYDLVARSPFAEPEDDEHGWCGDEPEPDMTDWRNWREGDKMKVTKTDKNDERNGLMTGDIVTLTQGNNNIPYCRTESGDIWAFGSKSLRFHSRPTKEQDK